MLTATDRNRTARSTDRNGSSKASNMMEDPQTPGSDCNSNPASESIDLMNSEFIQDNMDYQWFIDYRDGGLHIHPSILSSLSASYTKDDLGYYDDMARNLDANLAEVDMENFRTADIHNLLTALPVMCADPTQQSEGEDSACSTTDTISICKSSLLFSPVKEAPILLPGASYSVDSLDCEDMLLTCQTNNKNNYTIAFEGSMAMYSDGSQNFENHDKSKSSVPKSFYTKPYNIKNLSDMTCSDSKIFTTWSNLKHSSISKKITRHPSGNNNTIPNLMHSVGNSPFRSVKNVSQSLPDLTRTKDFKQTDIPLNISVDSGESSSRSERQSSNSMMSRSINDESFDSVGDTVSSKKVQNMSLLKLFMKQKSMSTEGMSLTLDQAESVSDNGWPTSNSDTETNTRTQMQRPTNKTSQGNGLAIKWVKADNCIKNSTAHSKLSACLSSLDDVSNILKSISLSDGKSSNTSSSSKQSSKTAGIQAKAEVEDSSAQTSLVYIPPNESENACSSSQTSNKKSSKPVYVIYPNYVLPDLSFLNSPNNAFKNVTLKPQGFEKCYKADDRSFFCSDRNLLKHRNFSHVKDWDSLNILLPTEYKKVLNSVPEISKHITMDDLKKPLFCLSPPMKYKRRTLNDILPTNISSSSSTTTQPSSGYRGSSTILTDSSSNQQQPFVYRYDSASSEASTSGQDKYSLGRKPNNNQPNRPGQFPLLSRRLVSMPHAEFGAPPRPPLPRSILRKNRMAANKRCSMFEMGQVEEENEKRSRENKRMSLQEPYYMNNDLHLLRNGGIIDSEKDIDETEENHYYDSNDEELRQLEDFLKRSGFSSHSSMDSCTELESDVKLKSCVKRFLALKMNQNLCNFMDIVDVQKKSVNFATNIQKDKTDAISLDKASSPAEAAFDAKSATFKGTKKLIWTVHKSVDLLVKFWHGEPNRSKQGINDKNECSQLCLGSLCPALYAVMSEDLKPNLDSTFGPIANSVWQVVEASSQQGPLTKTLNDLVQKINSEDLITEGMLKFHAFVFGLLNLRALDAWFAYLCTRESILRKHYNSNSLFVGALGCSNSRELVDAFLNILQPLAFCPFQLDLLYQYRQLHNSFGRASLEDLDKREASDGTPLAGPKKSRPRSCVLYESSKQESQPNKRWSHSPLSTKFHLYDHLDDSEDYTDSLEHVPLNQLTTSPKKCIKSKHPKDRKENYCNQVVQAGEFKFRRLQEKWEHIGKDEAGREQQQQGLTSPVSPSRASAKSKIPRLLTSPVKAPPNLPIPTKPLKSPTGIPAIKKPLVTGTISKTVIKKSNSLGTKDSPKHTSRVDQFSSGVPRSLPRPSSLPYGKTYNIATKDKNLTSPQRRAASTSLPRPTSLCAPSRNAPPKPPKIVKAVASKLQPEDGHLCFVEGDILKVVLEVDSKWLLCSRGDKKGLVSRNCVSTIPA